MAGGAALDEAAEPVGLLDVAELGERVRREGRVADPAVAVIPVALAAEVAGLGQRGGRRGDDRPGRLIAERLQNLRGAADALERPGPSTPSVGRPLAPPLDGLLQGCVDPIGVEVVKPRERFEVDRLPVAEAEASPLALADGGLGLEPVVIHHLRDRSRRGSAGRRRRRSPRTSSPRRPRAARARPRRSRSAARPRPSARPSRARPRRSAPATG